MKQYLDLVRLVMSTGHDKEDRTGTGTRSIFGHQSVYNLQEEFPILKEKFTAFNLVKSELLWFLKGSTNVKYLLENNNHIWDEWADKNGDLGPVYGKQWRAWEKYTITSSEDYLKSGSEDSTIYFNAKVVKTEIDQVKMVIDTLKTNPDSRRIIISAWNVSDIEEMALPPCHSFVQFYTRELSPAECNTVYHAHRAFISVEEKAELDKKYEGKAKTLQVLAECNLPTRALSCQLYQRSADIFLGVPFNIASYALLTHMIARVVNMVPDKFIHTLGDAHLYKNHFAQVEELLSRAPIEDKAFLWVNPLIDDIDKFTLDDMRLENYQYHPSIKARVAV